MNENLPRVYVPKPTGPDRDFYLHTLRAGLHLQTCSDCGHRQHPPRYFCGHCHSKRLAFTPAAATGTVYTLTVTHSTRDRGWMERTPYATLVVATDEGPRIVCAWHNSNVPAIGARVRIGIDPINEEFGLLRADALD